MKAEEENILDGADIEEVGSKQTPVELVQVQSINASNE